jgi:hypothetical protein
LAFSSLINAQTKHALLIGIGKYPTNDAKKQFWPDLSSDNDIRILKEALLIQKFSNDAITILEDENATVGAIKAAFDQLTTTVKAGDVVMIHFSGHGQQVRDLSGDEHDGFDEAMVCYDAPVKCYDGYTGQDHLLDDDLGSWFKTLRLKLGSEGHLLVLFDTCHSGTATRGSDDVRVRGGEGALEFDCNSTLPAHTVAQSEVTGWSEFMSAESEKAKMASMVVISGCRADETNYEVMPVQGKESFGSLSYSFVQVLNKPGLSAVSYADVLDELRKNISNTLTSDKKKIQTPQIEGDAYSKILNGSALEPSQYLQVYTSGKKNVEIEGGFLAGHGVGDSIAFYALSKLNDPIAVGVITQLHETRSGVQLKTALTNSYAQCKAKHMYSAASSIKRTLKITGECRNLEEIKSTLGKYPFFVLATEGATDYTLALDKKSFTIFSSDGITPLRSMKPTPVDSIHVLSQRLEEITRVEIFREKTQVETSIALDVRCARLKPAEPCDTPNERFDLQCIILEQEEGTFSYLKESEWPNNELYTLQDGDFICVYVYNNEPKSVYITPFEISPNGRIYMHGPDNELVSYREIMPSKDPVPISILQISNTDGYGPETMKLIVSKEPISLHNIPIAANGTDLSKQVYFSNELQTDNSLASMLGLRRKDGKRGSLDEDKDMSIINIPLIIK